VQGSHTWRADSAVFDEDNLVSHAGLVPLLELAEQTGLLRLLDEHVRFGCERVKSGAANATAKLTSIIAGMAAGADSIDDLDVVRAGGIKQVFGGVYAAATLGIFLREFTHGHTRQLSAVLRKHLVALAARTTVLDGIAQRAFIDIDSLLRPVYGHAKQGASFGHTKISGKTVLRRGLSPLAVTITTQTAAPVLAGVRLRAGRAASAKGAASMLTEAINTAKAIGAQPSRILVRGDSAYCSGKVVAAVVKAGAIFSLSIIRNPAVDAAIATIPDQAYTPVRYPGAVLDTDTGQLISNAQVAEVGYTAFADTRYRITGRLVVRRVLDANTQDPLFPRLAPPPVLHQQQRTSHRRGHHPPRPRHLRDRLVRPHRRPLGTPTLRHLRRQRRLDHPRRDLPQPATRRRDPNRRRPLRGSPRRHPTHPPDQRSRPPGPPTTPTRAAPARTLAPRPRLARVVDSRLHHLIREYPLPGNTTHHPHRALRQAQPSTLVHQTSKITTPPTTQDQHDPHPTTCRRLVHGSRLIGSVSLLRQDGSGSGWRVSTPLVRPLEVLRQTVRPLVVRRRDS